MSHILPGPLTNLPPLLGGAAVAAGEEGEEEYEEYEEEITVHSTASAGMATPPGQNLRRPLCSLTSATRASCQPPFRHSGIYSRPSLAFTGLDLMESAFCTVRAV
eukprot:scaffold15700_cov35-Prasinocladus_malaysianus.AAC.1